VQCSNLTAGAVEERYAHDSSLKSGSSCRYATTKGKRQDLKAIWPELKHDSTHGEG
jgi:hypothetical protein